MNQEARYYTIPKLAARLGVTAASVREWIQRGYIEEPPELPVTRNRAYPAESAERIERWYVSRAAHGVTRGPNAAHRRAEAVKQLAVLSAVL